MPKAPITYREAFITEIRGPGEVKLQRRLDWNMVQTELGPMVEPVASMFPTAEDSGVRQIDMTDAAFNKMSIIDEAEFNRRFGETHNGCTVLANFNA